MIGAKNKERNTERNNRLARLELACEYSYTTSSPYSRARETRARVKTTPREKGETRWGVIFPNKKKNGAYS